MRAWTYSAYGGPEVLERSELEAPVPGRGQVLVSIEVASINPADWHFMRGEPTMIRAVAGFGAPKPPAIIGSDVAGVVTAVGAGVTTLAVGDRVVAEVNRGACADAVVVPAAGAVAIPDALDDETAAALPMAGLTALQALRRVRGPLSGARVLVNGASGGIGSLAVQLAALEGAEVTGVCSARNLELVAGLGAARVVDYGRDDFTAGDPAYDVIVDTVGNRSTRDLRRALRRGGQIVQVAGGHGGRILGPVRRQLVDALVSPFVGRRFVFFVATADPADLAEIVALAADGRIRPLIDRVVPFDDVPAAMAHLETGHARGKVLVRIR